jgi:hypothetical protein
LRLSRQLGMVWSADRSRDVPLWNRLVANSARQIHAAAHPRDAAVLLRSATVRKLATQLLVASLIVAAMLGAFVAAAGYAPAWRGALAGALFGVWLPPVHHAIATALLADRAAAAAFRGGLGYWLGTSLSVMLLRSLPPVATLLATMPFALGGATGLYFISKNKSAFTEAQRHATSRRDDP